MSMLQHLKRPLAALDCESTGTDPATDRVVEFAAQVFRPGKVESLCRRVNPTIIIPAAASAIHGIHDEDVRDAPTFKEYAPILAALLDGADLVGFGIKKFDLRLLATEFQRAGVEFKLSGRRVIDCLDIFHANEPRDLAAAVKRYLRREHTGAHGAQADVVATVAVLVAQVEAHGLPTDIDELAKAVNGNALDIGGVFELVDGVGPVFRVGKHAGRPLAEVAKTSPDYLRWCLSATFLEDAKAMMRDAMAAPAPGCLFQDDRQGHTRDRL